MERRGEEIVCVGGGDKRRESGGETAQQYGDRQQLGNLHPQAKCCQSFSHGCSICLTQQLI